MVKYIIFQETGTSIPGVRLGLSPITHHEMALEAQNYRHGRTIVSAGFVEFVNGEARVSGRSDSLNLGPGPEDARLLGMLATCTAHAARASAFVQTSDQPLVP